jgi:predicted enzyme involved in methoxymalonyl-ACP biosynthesis
VCLSDKFSNLGIVGAIGIFGKTVDLFSLSCRALGRNVEYSMLDYLLQRKTSDVLYTSTTKNHAIKDFFCSNKYKIVEL